MGSSPNFALTAQTMGSQGINVGRAEELETAVKTAFLSEGSFNLYIFTNPNVFAMPLKVK